MIYISISVRVRGGDTPFFLNIFPYSLDIICANSIQIIKSAALIADLLFLIYSYFPNILRCFSANQSPFRVSFFGLGLLMFGLRDNLPLFLSPSVIRNFTSFSQFDLRILSFTLRSFFGSGFFSGLFLGLV